MPRSSLRTTPLRDGYDLTGTVTLAGKEHRLLYRPMLAHDIRSTVREARWISGSAGKEVIRSTALGQLLACDAELEALIHEGHAEAIPSLWRLVTGGSHPPFQSPHWERESARNLYAGQVVRMVHPEVAERSCESCKKWWYNHETGQIVTRGGEKLLRPEGQILPCQIGECAKGSPESNRTWTEHNRLAAEHFVRCESVGVFPDDPIVRRNATILRKALADATKALNRGRLQSGQAAR